MVRHADEQPQTEAHRRTTQYGTQLTVRASTTLTSLAVGGGWQQRGGAHAPAMVVYLCVQHEGIHTARAALAVLGTCARAMVESVAGWWRVVGGFKVSYR